MQIHGFRRTRNADRHDVADYAVILADFASRSEYENTVEWSYVMRAATRRRIGGSIGVPNSCHAATRASYSGYVQR